MKEYEFDRTRKNINVNKLSEEEREGMFERFVDSGGKIVRERSLEELKRREQYLSSAKDKEEEEKIPSTPQKVPVKGKLQKTEKKVKSNKFFSLLDLRFKSKVAGICPIFAKRVNSDFLGKLAAQLRNSSNHLKSFARELVNIDKELKGNLFTSLREQSPVFSLVIKQSVNIFMKQDALTLKSLMTIEKGVLFENAKPVTYSILLRLYELQSKRKIYHDCINYILKFLKENKKYNEGIRASAIQADKAWSQVLLEIYPKIVLLCERLEMKNFDVDSPAFAKTINKLFNDTNR